MRRLADYPLLVILTAAGAVSMLLPAAHAASRRDLATARPFLYSALIFLLLAAVVGIAARDRRRGNVARRELAALFGAYVWLPVMLAVPFHQVPGTGSFADAWFEMVSCFTTTGATLYEGGPAIPPTLHLWRAFVGWMGGYFILLAAAAVLAPLNLGGVEVLTGRVPGRGAKGAAQVVQGADPAARLARHGMAILPAYAGLTLALWVLLLLTGERGIVAFSHAMSTLATSGISPGTGFHDTYAGLAGEVFVFAFMALALTRRSLPGGVVADRGHALKADHEVRTAAIILTVVPLVLFSRHWIGAIEAQDAMDWKAAALALWGALFTTMSFLTTTGFESADWRASQMWSGLDSPGLILLGLAMVGGGIATTAGGLKLMRIYALARHGERELDRLVHPSSIGGSGEAARRLRRGGAYVAWVFFMLLAMTFALVLALLSLTGLAFEPALVLTVASVTTTGPLIDLAATLPIRLGDLGLAAKAVLACAMVVGRMEVLAILALVAPGVWRR